MFLERYRFAFIMTGFHAQEPREAISPDIRTALFAAMDRAQL
jgi:hypothetical protein